PRLLRPGWCYTPNYVVSCDFLPTALFVRRGHGCYYFGDYFGDRYTRRGFTPWFDVRLGGHAHDPLFAYYHSHARERTWENDLRTLYRDRARGLVAAPPRTLEQQNRLNSSLDRRGLTNGAVV